MRQQSPAFLALHAVHQHPPALSPPPYPPRFHPPPTHPSATAAATILPLQWLVCAFALSALWRLVNQLQAGGAVRPQELGFAGLACWALYKGVRCCACAWGRCRLMLRLVPHLGRRGMAP